MNISQAKYHKDFETEENVSINCVIDGVKHSIPIEPDNRHYQAILEWVADGNTIAEAD